MKQVFYQETLWQKATLLARINRECAWSG